MDTTTTPATEHPADALRRMVAGLTYKRGWTFKLFGPEHGVSPTLRISWRCEDSRNPGRRTVVVKAAPVPEHLLYGRPSNPAPRLMDWVRGEVHACETHEADEWLLFDGVRRYDPHEREGE